MLLNFTSDESLKNMDTAVKENMKDLKFWGDLNLSRVSLDILKNRIIILLERGMVFKSLFEQYPYAMVSYVVFLTRYKYKGDFWGMISEEIGIDKPNAPDQTQIGKMILKIFDLCELDYSVTKESNRKYVDSILYEVGIPPESNFGDLFYIFKYGLMSNVDPQFLIDEITSKEYGVHKPLLHFFADAPEERAINFVLDVQDTYLAATQTGDFSSKYSETLSEWLEQDKVKSAYHGKSAEEHVEVKPYFFFENGKRGLCIVLPRQNMTEEWVDSGKWTIAGDNGFRIEKECCVQGVEGKRFIDQMVISVRPCKSYILNFEYNDGFENHLTQYEIKGIEMDGCFYFDSNGRRVNQRYLRSPYEIVIYSTIDNITCNGIERDVQAYPLSSDDYCIEQITPLTTDAQFIIYTNKEEITMQMKPQIMTSLSGRKLFDTEFVDSEIPLFLEIPRVHINFEGFNSVEGIELRVGRTSIIASDLAMDEENIVDINECFDEKSYGIHSVRIYQFNRFIKQVRFCLLPEFKSDYFDNLKWLEDKANLKSESAKLTVRKVDGWQIDFANANVQDSLEKYDVRAPYREGTLNGTIISQQDNLRLAVEFELPICAYRYELISNNKISEKCDMADFLQGNPWLSVSFYGDYKKNTYVVELVSANGIEQREEIKLTSNGSANFDLNVFRDTLQAVPLPAKIRVVNADREASFDVILIDEVIKFRYRPKYVRSKKGIAVKDEDINKNATLEKYGDNFKLSLIYGESQVNDKGARIFSIPENVTLTSGYYRIIRENNVDELFTVDDDFEVTLQSDQFFVTLRNPKDPINSFGEWLEQFLYDLIRFRGIKKIDELRMSESYRCRNSMGQFAKFGLSDNDIINLVLLGNILECKITKAHKTIVTETMAMVSELILTNEDRFRIIERLVEMKASDIVFNLCKENYCLVLLEIPDTVTGSYIKELASALKQVSVILALQVLLKGNVPIRETFGIAAYRDVIGQDAIIEMMTTNEREGKKTEDRKHFLLEDGVSCVHIALNSNISGINNFYEMADEKKLRTGRVHLDKNKIPEIGTYFAGTRYIDLFVNWYIRNHMGDTNNDSDLRKRMQLQFESFESKVWNKISSVRNSKADSFFKEFNSVLMERVANKSDISNMTSVHFTFPAYFYFEGIAALIAQLDEFNEFPEMKKEAVKFMVGSFQVAPFMSERDVLMAMSYIYLRRKERR